MEIELNLEQNFDGVPDQIFNNDHSHSNMALCEQDENVEMDDMVCME